MQKAMLTGAMCAIAPGSPVQLLVALVLCTGYLLLLVFARPFKGQLEDQLAGLTGVCLCASLLAGLVLIMDRPEPENTFDADVIGTMLIAINVLPLLFMIYATLSVNVGFLATQSSSKPVGLTVESHAVRARRKSLITEAVERAVVGDQVARLESQHYKALSEQQTRIKTLQGQAKSRLEARLKGRAFSRVPSSGGASQDARARKDYDRRRRQSRKTTVANVRTDVATSPALQPRRGRKKTGMGKRRRKKRAQGKPQTATA